VGAKHIAPGVGGGGVVGGGLATSETNCTSCARSFAVSLSTGIDLVVFRILKPYNEK